MSPKPYHPKPKHHQEHKNHKKNLELLLQYVQKEPGISFFALSDYLPTLSNPELGGLVKELSFQGHLVSWQDSFYATTQLAKVEGFVHANVNGGLWLDSQDGTNTFGLQFSADPKLIILNKKQVPLKSKVQGYLLPKLQPATSVTALRPPADLAPAELLEKYGMFYTHTLQLLPCSIIACANQDGDWNILNHSLNQEIHMGDAPRGTISVFSRADKLGADGIVHTQLIQKESLGSIKDLGMESKVLGLLAELTQAPKLEQPASPLASPVLMDTPFYTIDGPFTKDVDDALFIQKTSAGFHLKVAISDVSGVVHLGSAQDLHARKVATSFYLPHQTIHMLPNELSENYCSLNVGQNRPAMVCEMELSPKGEILSFQFKHATIKVHHRLSYDDVDLMLKGLPPKESFTSAPISSSGPLSGPLSGRIPLVVPSRELLENLQLLHQAALCMNRSRAFLGLKSPEFELGADGKVQELYYRDEHSPAQKMVENAMLSANICTARHLATAFPFIGLFRNQLETLNKNQPAFYDFTNHGHFSLQTDFYTHFTSPIRRYCDLMVHRLLKQSLGLPVQKVLTPEQIEQEFSTLAKTLNDRHYQGKQLGLRGRNWLTQEYIEKLVATKSLDTHWQCADLSAQGLVLENRQHLQFFMPYFTLRPAFAHEEHLARLDAAKDMAARQEVLASFNRDFAFTLKFTDYNWQQDNHKSRSCFWKATKTASTTSASYPAP